MVAVMAKEETVVAIVIKETMVKEEPIVAIAVKETMVKEEPVVAIVVKERARLPRSLPSCDRLRLAR